MGHTATVALIFGRESRCLHDCALVLMGGKVVLTEARVCLVDAVTN